MGVLTGEIWGIDPPKVFFIIIAYL